MEFPLEIESKAFKAENGEYAWLKENIPAAVEALVQKGFAILGGEVWLVRGREINAAPLLKTGPCGIFHWESKRADSSESWSQFVQRSAGETLQAVHNMNVEDEIVAQPEAKIFYNITWCSEEELSK